MPELPDLQVFSMQLHKQLAGRKLKLINLPGTVRPNVPKARLKKTLEGQRLVKVYREGKELRMAFAKGHTLGLHMMLRGKLEWLDKNKAAKYTLLELWFEGDRQLALTDYQRKARITLDPEAAETPDALSKEANAGFWKKQLQKRTAIKKLLLDQHIVRGIGNAYADEILWQAGISPFSASNKIPPAKVKDLMASIKKVMKNAIRQIQKAAPGIIGGELRDFLLIHNAHRKKSPKGAPILVKASGGRKTYYTKEQKLYT
jgi:formamidopyrimidine-DNA glycosylase